MKIVMQGIKVVKNYFKQMREQGTEEAYESKVLIVGEGESGKSTLFQKLQDNSLLLPDTKSTLGVEIKEGVFFTHSENKDIQIAINLWDFGGQEIQYQLHQYFITPDALYILVADNRKQNTRWDYWFQIIRLLGGNCTVLVVINNKKTMTSISDFQRDKHRENFKELTINEIDIDFNINDSLWENLLNTIRRELSHLPFVKKTIPKLWKPLRDELNIEKQNANHISIIRFLEIANLVGLKKEEDALGALDYFHRVGVVLHFSEDKNLRDVVFLNPNWITQGLYAALNKENAEIKNGCFSETWMNEFWANHKNKYSYTDRTYLLRLMLKDNFDICYELPDKRYRVPMLLDDTKPKYEWEPNENLHFRFQYPFLPEGIISRLIVRLHTLIEDDLLVWKEGVIFKNKAKNCRAEVIQKSDMNTGLKYIGIRVNGTVLNDRKDLLSKIREQIDHIHTTAFTRIPVSELVFCNCAKCSTSDDPYFYTLQDLRDYLADNELYIECRKLRKRVSITDLLGAVYPQEEIEQRIIALQRFKGGETHIHGDAYFSEKQIIDKSQTLNITNITNNVTVFLKEFKQLKEEGEREKYIDSFSSKIPEGEVTNVKEALNSIFPKFKILEKNSQTFLITGEYLRKYISKETEIDFSPVVLQYGRAIEQEFIKLGISGTLGNCQKKLIKLLGEYYRQSSQSPEILDKLEENNLSLSIFLPDFLGYTISPWTDCPDVKETMFYKNISDKRNAAGHSGDDSLFTKEQADSVIKDMTDYLKEWTEITFKNPENSALSN